MIEAIFEFGAEVVLRLIAEVFSELVSKTWRRLWKHPEKLELRAENAHHRAAELRQRRLDRKARRLANRARRLAEAEERKTK